MDYLLTGNRFLYSYAHMALPILALGNPKKFYRDVSSAGGKRYLVRMWEGLAGRMDVRQPHAGLDLTMRTLRTGVEVALIRMPRPTATPEAFYIGVAFQVKKRLLRTEALSARYFTLELGCGANGLEEEYHFCEWAGRA